MLDDDYNSIEPFIRYEVEVEAANAAGKGITTPFKFYTLESGNYCGCIVYY